MPLERFVDSLLDYFRLPQHKKVVSPGTGARVDHEELSLGPPADQIPLREMEGEDPSERVETPSPEKQIPRPNKQPSPSSSRNTDAQGVGSLNVVWADEPPASPGTVDDPIRILLVEDDPKWAQLVKAYVAAINNERSLGVLELVWVETLADTIEKISKRSYDLIFLDLMLPDSHGINTLEAVWGRAVRVRTPVVVMSNLDSGGVIERVREVTGRDILLKKNISKRVLFGHIDFNVFED